MAQRSWENSDEDIQGPAAGGHTWEDSDDDGLGEGVNDSGSDSDDSVDFDTMTKDRATHEFLELLLSAYFDTSISAQLFCNLCFFLGKAGL